jgi:hypothetical protein
MKLYCELAQPKRLYTMMTNLENTSQIVLNSNLLKLSVSSLNIKKFVTLANAVFMFAKIARHCRRSSVGRAFGC